MPEMYEIRADYDKSTIVVYQAFCKDIAKAAIKNNTFVEPFLFDRMTWIKPSFLWLMERSGWAQKANQEYILAVRITRKGWEEALDNSVLTTFYQNVYTNHDEWKHKLKKAKVRVQWDPERTISGHKLEYRSIQVGLSRKIVGSYVKDWIVGIDDYTQLARRIYNLKREGKKSRAKELLPKERIYKLPSKIAKKVGIALSYDMFQLK